MRQTARTGCIPIPNEDHTFVVLQGEAKFYWPNHETRTIGKNEGVSLPHDTFTGSKRRTTGNGHIGAAAFDGVYGERKSISVDVHTHGGKTGITSKAPLNGVLSGL
jgi:hypothetical protein